jgi:hypothetical protein
VIPSRNVWHPLGRSPPPRHPAPEPVEPDEEQLDQDGTTEIDEEEAELSDAAFLKSLRQDVDGVREGLVTSITDAMPPALKDRPWGRRHKRRDRHGKAF